MCKYGFDTVYPVSLEGPHDYDMTTISHILHQLKIKALAGLSVLVMIVMLLTLAACGGGGGGGSVPAAPVVNAPPTISGTAPPAEETKAFSFTPTANDPEGGALTFSITGQPGWTEFSTATGALTGTPVFADLGTHANIVITVSDGNSGASITISIDVDPNVLEKAIREGDASGLADAAPVFEALTALFDANTGKFDAARAKIFGLDGAGDLTADSLTGLSWDPTHDAALLLPSFGFNESLLITNDVTDPARPIRNEHIGIVGDTETSRYVVLGSNPFRNFQRDRRRSVPTCTNL